MHVRFGGGGQLLSYYGWRGADINNILDFEKDWPEAEVIRLEENYRSVPDILECANTIIRNNKKRKKKSLWTANQDTTKKPMRKPITLVVLLKIYEKTINMTMMILSFYIERIISQETSKNNLEG